MTQRESQAECWVSCQVPRTPALREGGCPGMVRKASLKRWSMKSGKLLNKPKEDGRAEHQEISWVKMFVKNILPTPQGWCRVLLLIPPAL